MNETSDLFLMHHGIKGMHWGVRRFEDANGHLTPAGKRRYAVQDARKYYKINRLQRAREKTDDDKVKKALDGEIRRTKTRSDRKQALLSKKDIDIGREIVAKHRLNWAGANTAAKAALTAAGAYALYKNPNTRALAPLALAGGAALTYGSAKKIPYYFMENRRYKQGNEKGATKKGLTKNQQRLRKVGKAAAIAALAGAAGYALVKSGAVQNAVDRYKGILPFDKAVKVSNAEQRVKNAFGIKTARQRQKEQMAAEEHEANNRSNNSSGYRSTKSNPSDATRDILDANQRAQTARKVNNGTATIRSNGEDRPLTKREKRLWNALNGAATKAGSRAQQGARSAAKSGKKKASNALKRKIVGDIDENDPRTWITAARNAKDTVSDIKRYGRAINKMRKGDTIGAAAEVSDELTDTANKLIEGTQSRIDKAKSGRRSRKSKLK